EVCVYRRRGAAILGLAAAGWLVQAAGAASQGQAKPGAPLTDLDAFMSRVLERRNENWKTLHDYILSERETFRILGPGGVPLAGQRREFQWFIRDGYLVRSPVKANGASLGEADRRKYEADWLKKEQDREQRTREKALKRDKAVKQGADSVEAAVVEELRSIEPGSDKEVVALVGTEPRFISEAYFMKFPFEPGNYYLAGRETIDGRPVVKVEYYPSRLFGDDKNREKKDKGDDLEDEIEAALNKVTLVTMWIDPQEFQIVRFAFDNADWGFLPGRAIVRVDQAKATMAMGRYFDNVWLPKEIAFNFGATFAAGSYTFRYTRDFYDYRKGEVSARIRGYVPKEP
ncbi:MAG: hypothetical protein R6V57_07475, partial [Vicinamibacterales bacterium]